MTQYSLVHVALSKNMWALQTSHFIVNEFSLLPLRDALFFFFPIISFIHCHSLSRMRILPAIHCVNVIQFGEMCAAAAKSHCYTLRQPIWKKPQKRLYNHSVQDKSCLVLILRSSYSRNTTTMHFIADEPVTCGREGCLRWTHRNIYTWKLCLFNRIINGQLRNKSLWGYISKIYKLAIRRQILKIKNPSFESR